MSKLPFYLRCSSATMRLRKRVCRRCDELFMGTKYARYCSDCNKIQSTERRYRK